ncbi:LuxR C-terminal-related transcriptional regulator [uncultured Pseudomonas sp.]|uniref:helix-turn-helix transcriptional regulator n=1 Tax=uncultured Pseudomonas sp. TaxID=114707 RepID=UPI00258742F3|nr:LuxR C-terminal-related transcriptional regulator [uncultured Pseudomonas sp.]
MTMTLHDIAFHQTVAALIEALERPHFWRAMTCALAQYVHHDSWVALVFSEGRPQVLAESPGDDGAPDRLFQDYLHGLYLLDPFYIASRESQREGLVRLSEIAPDCFEQTDYYQRYFSLNVVADEVQFNVALPGARTLCLSLGSRQRFQPDQIALLSLVAPWVTALVRQRLRYEPEPSEPTAAPPWQERLERMARQVETALTGRELEVARLVLSGYSSKEVARKLTISAETVKVHRKHVYSKLGIKSQSELFAVFLQAQRG